MSVLVKRLDIGNWVPLYRIVGKSKGCVVTLIERRMLLYFAILMPDRTAMSMKIAAWCSHLRGTPRGNFSRLQLTEERSLHAMPVWKLRITCTFILLIRIPLGNAVPTRMRMVYYESSTPKVQISLKWRMKNSHTHSI